MPGGAHARLEEDRPDARPSWQARAVLERLAGERRQVAEALLPLLERPLAPLRGKLRFRKRVLVVAGILAVVVLVGAKSWAWLAHDPGWAGERVVAKVMVNPGMTLRQVADELHRQRLLDKPQRLLLAARLLGGDRAIQVGVFILDSGMSPTGMLRQLLFFSVPMIKVRIPEGARTADAVGLLARETGRDSLLMMQLVRDTSFVRLLGVRAPDLDGMLFPDTYFLSPADDERAILFKAVARFQHLMEQLAAPAALDTLDLHRLCTLASIVQAEYQLPGEADTIATVYLNRLAIGMKLQADPTVQFLLPQSRRLYLKDLAIRSPYNTYRHVGLPPGPIGNPGRVALQAVLEPARCDYLYFVSLGDGSHAFSRSYEEHLVARQRLDALRERLEDGELVDSLSQLEAAALAEAERRPPDSARADRRDIP